MATTSSEKLFIYCLAVLAVLSICSNVLAAPMDVSDTLRLVDAQTNQTALRCGPDANIACAGSLTEGSLTSGEIGGSNVISLTAPRLGAASVVGNGGVKVFGMLEANTESGSVDLNTPGAVSDYVSVTVSKNPDNTTATLTIIMTSDFSQAGLAVIPFDDMQVEDTGGRTSMLTSSTLDKLFTPGIFTIEAVSDPAVPEPATLLLLSVSLLSLGLVSAAVRRH